eukprot:scaffold656083_cov45-Prasinocladus_malaysianus.AAC.1
MGVVPPLVGVLRAEDTWGAEKDTAASALQRLAQSGPGRAAIMEAGGVPALVTVLRRGSDGQREAAALALEELAQDHRLA